MNSSNKSVEINKTMPTFNDLEESLSQLGYDTLANSIKYTRKHTSLMTDEYWTTYRTEHKEALRIFLKNCDGIIFLSRQEVLHTLVNKLDSYLIEQSYGLLVKEMEKNIDHYNDVFTEFGIYHAPSVYK